MGLLHANDFSRTILKAILLPLSELYRKIRPYDFRKTHFPSVSVIIPAHNEEETIEDCIMSVLEDPYPNKEIIVVDDGSTDHTENVAKKYPVKYVFQTHQGVSAAKNYGIKVSKGEFFVCLDADDRLAPKLSLIHI